MKKLVALMLTLTLIGALFAGCGQKDTPKDDVQVNEAADKDESKKSETAGGEIASGSDPVTINILHRWPPESEKTGELLRDVFETFDERNDDIVVKIDTVPASMYEAQLTVRLASNEAPDVYCLWPGGRTESQLRNGAVMEISDVWENNGFYDDFTPSIVAGSTHPDGNIYTLPMDNMTNAFWYNKKVFDDLGIEPPQTWEELMDAAEKIKATGMTPFALGGNPTRWMPAFWFDYLLLNTAGGDFRERLMWGQESWESEEVYRVFEIWKVAIDNGYFNEDYVGIDAKQAMAKVSSGECAMMLQGPWAINNLIGAGWTPEEDFNMFPFPEVIEGVPQASQGAIQAWCINPNNDDPTIEATKRLFAYMGSAEVQSHMAQSRNTLGARKDTGFDVYTEQTRAMLQSLSEQTGDKPLHVNFELATLPAMQDAGMDAIIEFMTFPDQYKEICARLEMVSRETFDQ